MKPTAQLRFVKREREYVLDGLKTLTTTVNILQQWWVAEGNLERRYHTGDDDTPYGEWRDVPVEEEK